MPHKKQHLIKKTRKAKHSNKLKDNEQIKPQAEKPLASKSVKVSQGNPLEQGTSGLDKEMSDANPALAARASHLEDHVAGLHQRLKSLCAEHPHLAGQLRQHQSQFRIKLPDALPSSMLLRALGKSRSKYNHLSEERVAVFPDDPSQITLRLDGLKREQLTIFVKELEEVISEFTGRN